MRNSIALLLFLAADLLSSSRAIATGIGSPFFNYSDSTYCFACNYSSYQPYRPMWSFMPADATQSGPWSSNYAFPYWSGYGAMSYSNYNYPGAWGMNGIQSSYYPWHGHGGGFAAKPNVYVTAKKSTEIKIKVHLRPSSHWLVASPIHGSKGWSGVVGPKGVIQASKAKLDYFYYDYRFDENQLQDEAGFCTEGDQLIPKMITILEQSSFKSNEIEDFVEHWSQKIPPSDRYCVYPQTSDTLDKVATLAVHPKPKSVKRILFIVVVNEALKSDQAKAAGKFAKAPTRNWNLPPSEPLNRAISSEAVSSDIEVREWGVGFLQSR